MQYWPLLTVKLDREAPAPLAQQLAGCLRRMIAGGGELRNGAVLPSTRWLARRLQVSRNTVIHAYETLASEGLLVAKTGSCTRVRALKPVGIATPRRHVLRGSHYPLDALPLCDPEGNLLYLHGTF